ncbi:MAG TPA: DNA polymerase III subunit gamma/tau [Candidatus Woesebacteria bacterium]|nr:DNA polymerase III subunit gamma/tau [Candidatus Woesebacteria bacterium]HPR99578.1 DNA polymerase III subunit gamma/tau [Candidatus Woesebacteria bacterium]
MSVFHLKYRPQKIADLDLPEVSDKINSIISSETDFQSLLFAGPKGSGKTSAARIIAKAVNCLKIKKGEACGECENCLEIEKGNSLDIIEIDAASNRGIDDVRGLKENAYLSPIRLKKKIFIIDEVHMLTKEAFNALLKIIEEPPKNTLFILCTTDAQKIPETVLSRLLRVNFRKGKEEDLERSLAKVIKGEKIEISDEAKKEIILNSDGSFRNLQKTFNEIVLQFGNKIDKEQVEKYFTVNRGEYGGEELEKDLKEGRIKKIVEKLEKMAEKGVDFGELRLKWLEYFHQKMLLNLDDRKLGKWIEILIRSGEMEKIAIIEQLPLELAVIEMMGSRVIMSPKVDTNPVEVEIAEVEEKWGEILGAVKPYNHSVEAFLRAARPKKIKDGKLLIEVFYKFHKEKLEEEKNRKIVEIGLEKVFGGVVRFDCILAQADSKKTMPMAIVNKRDEKVVSESEIYDVAKNIFG